jgi:hypothetical protein
MNGQARRGAYTPIATVRIRPGLRKSDPIADQPVAQRSVRRPLAFTAQDDQLLLEQAILRDYRPHATGATASRS